MMTSSGKRAFSAIDPPDNSSKKSRIEILRDELEEILMGFENICNPKFTVFSNLPGDLKRLIIRWTWTEETHKSLVLVSKFFRDTILRVNFFLNWPMFSYFPSGSIFRLFMPSLFLIPSSILEKTAKIQIPHLHLFQWFSSYERFNTNALRLLLYSTSINRYSDLCNLFKIYYPVFSIENLIWFALIFDNQLWSKIYL